MSQWEGGKHGQLHATSKNRFQTTDSLEEIDLSTFPVDNPVEKGWKEAGKPFKSRKAAPLPIFLAKTLSLKNRKIRHAKIGLSPVDIFLAAW
ncbi:MAG: hypothetical protein HKL98_09535 [Burkholderiales bacterium]|nr:hypothetical protein [Burkholderiales bacterium]